MNRILFVDDERHVLDGLRALLRPQRSRWEMVFVDSGERALAELAASNFDVIVSDMKMPAMDGATLLRRTEVLHPDVVRIVLSGFAEFETALRTVPVAHHFLVKPCDVEVLVNVIERAWALQSRIGSAAVRAVVGAPEHLPPLPATYLALTQMLVDDAAGVAEIATVIRRDLPIADRALQLVNSAFLGLGREIVSIEQATAYLGTNMLKNIVLTAQVFSGERSPAEGLWMHRAQRHSLLVGTIARRITAADKRASEDAFIAGVLHDIGKRVQLDGASASRMSAIEARCRTEQRPRFEIEREELGVTHAELGGHLLGRWGLPYPVIEAAGNHHTPQDVRQLPGLDVLGAVYVANVLAHEQARACGGDDEPFAPLDGEYLRMLGVDARLPEWRAIAAQSMGATRSSLWSGDSDARAA
jgi:HD-like signal output (HDOD) protein/CheY-like chemotaxis protein